MRERVKTKTLRCAIYTRKSSEEGLEQDFNSLHAQREACEAYIKSQKHEGWTVIPAAYDDGGFSGGTMERPALQKLLADIRSRTIDVVVVYKVDRLTRSLMDFAKIVEVFDAQGVSFVSVTQAFNTTSSMGRLTLNVLLSFAQFEREVTGERIRDKIAASKKKGLWMGGWVPIGYDAKDRTLVINETEAETVRVIFRLYLELGTVRTLEAEIAQRGLRTKRYTATTGRVIGDRPFSRGHLYKILGNPLYIGEIDHKGTCHPGQHPAIIDRETWGAVQAKLTSNTHERQIGTNSKESSLLAGLLFDEEGRRLTATHAVKGGKRYRYYAGVTSSGRMGEPSRYRISAAEIEVAVIRTVVSALRDPSRLMSLLARDDHSPDGVTSLLARAEELAGHTESEIPVVRRETMLELVHRIEIGSQSLRIVLNTTAFGERMDTETVAPRRSPARIPVIDAAIAFTRHGGERRILIEGQPVANDSMADPTLLKALARGHVWFEDLVTGRAATINQIAKDAGVTDRYVSRLLNLAFLAPKVIERLLDHDGPPGLTTEKLTQMDDLPASWSEQCQFLECGGVHGIGRN